MQLGALNYANNAALLLTCFLAAAAWMSLFAGFRTLAGLELVAIHAAECHAGHTLPLMLHFLASDAASAEPAPAHRRRPVRLCPGPPATARDRHPAARAPAWLDAARAHEALDRATARPLRRLELDQSATLDPGLSGDRGIRPTACRADHGEHGERFSAGDGDEFSGLRDYRSGDPQRRIAWKASARHDGLLVRESEVPVDDNRVLAYASLRRPRSRGTHPPPDRLGARRRRGHAELYARLARSADRPRARPLPSARLPACAGPACPMRLSNRQFNLLALTALMAVSAASLPPAAVAFGRLVAVRSAAHFQPCAQREGHFGLAARTAGPAAGRSYRPPLRQPFRPRTR